MGSLLSKFFSPFYKCSNEQPINTLHHELANPRNIIDGFISIHRCDVYLTPNFIKIKLLEDFIYYWESQTIKQTQCNLV